MVHALQMRSWGRLRPRAGRLPLARHFSQSDRPPHQEAHHEHQQWNPLHSVRILGPTVWSVAAIVTIYFTCAAFDVYADVKKHRKDRRPTLTFEQIEAEADRAPQRARDLFTTPSTQYRGPIAAYSPLDLWDALGGPAKVMAGVTGVNALNLAVKYAPSTATQDYYRALAHTPAQGAFRYPQLLTCVFAHTGVVHFGINTWVMFNFAPALANTPLFHGSGSHTLAFYLSSGIISSLGRHISTNFWPNKLSRFIPGIGFSGVVSAIFGAWCVEHANGRVRLILIPWDFTAGEALVGLTVFETLGTLGLLNFAGMNVAHSAHLGGLLFGAAYATYGGAGRYWTPFRRAAFRGLKTVGAI